MNIQKIDFNEIVLNDTFNKDIHHNEIEKNEQIERKNKKGNEYFNDKDISQIKEKIENVAASLNFQIEFKQHKDTKRFYVEIIDKKTKKIIREIPPEQILDFLSRFEKMLGILFDRRT